MTRIDDAPDKGTGSDGCGCDEEGDKLARSRETGQGSEQGDISGPDKGRIGAPDKSKQNPGAQRNALGGDAGPDREYDFNTEELDQPSPRNVKTPGGGTAP